MAAASFPLPPVLTAPSPLSALLAPERNAHERQRELVRASLLRCPRETRAKA